MKFINRFLLLISAMMLLTASNVSATIFDFDMIFTADNEIDMLEIVENGSVAQTITTGTNWNNWPQTDSYHVTWDSSIVNELSLVWTVSNWITPQYPVGSGNPGGFLAEISGIVPIAVGSPLSSSAWQVSSDGANWVNATEYGANNGPAIWSTANTINDAAQWIWTDDNITENQDNPIQVKVTFATPVPEPATVVLFGLGLLGLTGISRKKFKK